MAKIKFDSTKVTKTAINKKTSQGMGNIKFSSMNKKKKSNFKKYRGQGKV